MNINTLPTIGQYVRITAHGEVVGGGEVLEVEPYGSITVAQPYTYRHNGVIVEQGTNPTRYQIITHEFEVIGEDEESGHAIAPDAGRNVRCICGAEYSLTVNLIRHISQRTTA